jgi:hypothetical protein
MSTSPLRGEQPVAAQRDCDHAVVRSLQTSVQMRGKCGEGAWESNPPARLVTPLISFEDCAGHRARSAPKCHLTNISSDMARTLPPTTVRILRERVEVFIGE